MNRTIHFPLFPLYSYHDGRPFSTKDQDSDVIQEINCSERYKAGWWHKGCYQILLTGKHGEQKILAATKLGVHWLGQADYNTWDSLKSVKMMLMSK